jgi:hypothetical protein
MLVRRCAALRLVGSQLPLLVVQTCRVLHPRMLLQVACLVVLRAACCCVLAEGGATVHLFGLLQPSFLPPPRPCADGTLCACVQGICTGARKRSQASPLQVRHPVGHLHADSARAMTCIACNKLLSELTACFVGGVMPCFVGGVVLGVRVWCLRTSNIFCMELFIIV